MKRRRFPLAPQEGWLTLGLVLLICLTLAWSVDGVRWVLGRDEYLDYLVVAAAMGVLIAFIGAKVGWGRWLTYFIGAVFAALLVPIMTAMMTGSDGRNLGQLYHATAEATVSAFYDVVINGAPSTIQYLHWILIFGLIIWATSMFASYAVFGHRRALNAAVVVGVLLVGNMAFTLEDQLPLLVVFTLASLFLLIRSHVFDEQSEWLRRRIGDPASISSVYLRGGTTFIVVTVIGAFFLTQTASSRPLAGAWDGVGDSLLDVSRAISKYLPNGGSTRAIGLSFGADSQVRQLWSNSADVAVTIQRDPSDKEDYYWRVATYDVIGVTGWKMSNTTTEDRPAGQRLLGGKADDIVDSNGLLSVKFTVIPDTFRDKLMISPATPMQVDRDTKVTLIAGSFFARLDRNDSGPYQITALVGQEGTDPGEYNVADLQQAGQDYPTEIRDHYLQVDPAIMGPNALALKAKIQAAAIAAAGPDAAPIDYTEAIMKELRSNTYTYRTDVRSLHCEGLSTVECFARFKQGFCQYYAPTMAVIRRSLGVPTRIVEGFLPGERSGGNEVLRNHNAHAWVEVYFPGFNWVKFDPTGAGNPAQDPATLPAGNPSASRTPRPSASGGGPLPTIPGIGQERDPGGSGAAGSTSGRTSLGPLVGVGLLLLAGVLIVSFLAWRRGPRGATTADSAYGMVTRMAARLGFGPRPNQTVYEYAGVLGDVLPDVRPELQTVAHAKVESVYAREILSSERLDRLRDAQRRLRMSLLRLVFRRQERKRRRR
jgi:transglutaminase-like putative cysteine protease